MRIEHEYVRRGAWACLAARDVRRAKIHGIREHKTGIAPFGRLLQQVMTQEPYRSARRVFWTMDNGSSHRGQACVDHIGEQWPTIVPVHTPVHASWLNQVEIYFSILQRKALTPNDFPSLEALQERLLGFARYYEAIANPSSGSSPARTSTRCCIALIAPMPANSPYSQPRRIRVRTYDLRALRENPMDAGLIVAAVLAIIVVIKTAVIVPEQGPYGCPGYGGR